MDGRLMRLSASRVPGPRAGGGGEVERVEGERSEGEWDRAAAEYKTRGWTGNSGLSTRPEGGELNRVQGERSEGEWDRAAAEYQTRGGCRGKIGLSTRPESVNE